MVKIQFIFNYDPCEHVVGAWINSSVASWINDESDDPDLALATQQMIEYGIGFPARTIAI